MRLNLRIAAAALVVMSIPARASAQAGALDPTFGVNGKVVTSLGGGASSVAIQADGKIVVTGVAGPPLGNLAVARYNSNGLPDSTFGVSGTASNDFGGDEYASAVAIQLNDQKVVVAGTIDFTNFLVARYNPNGTLDSTFGPGGHTITDFGGDETLTALAIQPSDGKIVAVGDSFTDTFAGWVLARYNTDGTPDSGFGTAGKVLASFAAETQSHAIAIQSDGKIVVAGYIFTNPTTDYVLARYNADGTPDSTFGAGGTAVKDFGDFEYAFGMAIQADGRIVVAGGSGFDFAVARFNTDGNPDLSFGAGGQMVTDFGGSDLAYSMALQANGKIVTAGRSRPAFGADDFALASYNADGSLDTTFDMDGKVITDFTVEGSPGAAFAYSAANAVAIQADGNIVAAGFAWTGEGQPNDDHFALARYVGGNSPAGSNVVVAIGGVTLTFQNVTQAGDTTLTTSSSGPAPPDGFSLGTPATYFDITTTAIYSGLIGVCINYSGMAFADEASLQLLHFDGVAWTNVTASLDTVNDVICGSASSLSPFIVAAPAVVRAITASVDVQPQTINTKKKGLYISVYIEFPGGEANPADIDVSSVTLSTSAGGTAVASGSSTAIGDGNRNGVIDLMVKFDRAAVQSLFPVPGAQRVHVSGRLIDGTQFEGEDLILVTIR
jgi:uncharacterized delta-60 repeat protein